MRLKVENVVKKENQTNFILEKQIPKDKIQDALFSLRKKLSINSGLSYYANEENSYIFFLERYRTKKNDDQKIKKAIESLKV